MGDALQYPLNDDSWLRKILIGGALNLASVLVIPVFFLIGYQLRTMRTGMSSGEDLPEFDEWGEMFATGLAGVGIGLTYLLPAILLFVGGGVLRGIGMLALLAGLYLIPAGLANYLRDGSFGAGLNFGNVLAIARDSEYITHWIMAFVLGLVGTALSGALQVVLIGFFLQFYFNLAIFYLMGRGVARSMASLPAPD